MNSLYRELAPISDAAWEEIRTEAQQTLKRTLAARRLVDCGDPHGWGASSVDLGRSQVLEEAPRTGVEARRRAVQPMLEIRVPFELARSEVEAIDRGARDGDLQPVIDAARNAAMTEDSCIFYGYSAGQITGICEAAAAESLALTSDYTRYPDVVAEAVNRLRMASVDGPYAIALGPRCYTGLTQTREGGYPVIEHVRRLVEGPIVWAPAADGALVVSLRGGDFELTLGQDFSIGYLDHTASAIHLYVQESFTFLVNTPEAAIPLRYPADARQ
ncbi:MAG: family 1 encapsulin nanocompartment shell protein [Gammaproteobacteria bacterium]|jgi:uncharacterized linocin/CFP29 family protein